MWNFMDDYGIIPYSAKQLSNQILPAEKFEVDVIISLVKELITNELVKLYRTEDGKTYLWAITWSKHQKVDKPNDKHPKFHPSFEITLDQIIPCPNATVMVQVSSASTPRTLPYNSASTPLTLPDSSATITLPLAEHSPPEGKGREGKGKEQTADNSQFTNQKFVESEFLGPYDISSFEQSAKKVNDKPFASVKDEAPLEEEIPPRGKKEKTSATKEKKRTLLEDAHQPCQKTFMDFYQTWKRKMYLWSAKDGMHMKLVIGKILTLVRQSNSDTKPDVKSVQNALAHILEQLPQLKNQWIFDNLSVSLLSSKFNEITDQIINNNATNDNRKPRPGKTGQPDYSTISSDRNTKITG